MSDIAVGAVSDTVRIVFGLSGLVGGTAGLVGAFIVWKTGRRSIDNLKKRLDLPKGP